MAAGCSAAVYTQTTDVEGEVNGFMTYDRKVMKVNVERIRKINGSVIEKLRKEENMTVFLTTHYMEEAADADYVVILDSGKIAAKGTPLSLKNEYAGDYITLYGIDENEVKNLGIPYEKIKDAFRISVPNTGKATELILSQPQLFRDYEIIKGNMDDVFLAVTGKKLVGGAEK